MVRTTRAQREALFHVFRRSFPGWVSPTRRVKNPEIYNQDIIRGGDYKELQAFAERHPNVIVKVPSIQYRNFLKSVRPFPVASDPCIMLPWAGMWLGIEKDGYTHS